MQGSKRTTKTLKNNNTHSIQSLSFEEKVNVWKIVSNKMNFLRNREVYTINTSMRQYILIDIVKFTN